MTPKDKHTEVAWQAKQREVKTGSVEKTVHSATSESILRQRYDLL